MNLSLFLLALLVASIWRIQTGGEDRFNKGEYAARRNRLMDKIGDGVALFLGAVEPDGDVPFRQGHDFMYLTGVAIPGAFLIVDGLRKESVLFFTISEEQADGGGISLDLVRKPAEVTGIEKVLPAEQFGPYLDGLSSRASVFFTMFKPEELGPQNSNEKFNSLQKTMTLHPWDGRLTRELQFVENLRKQFPEAEVRDCSPIVWDLRKIKSAAELDVLRQAAQIGVEAHKALIQSARPGVAERSLAALFEFTCKCAGAKGVAYETIIMSGKNHAYGHYHQYDRVLNAGDFLILDAGPDLDDYHVDISTTFPASESCSPRQAELYEIALAVHDVCEQNYRPGVTLKQVGEKVDEYLKANGLEDYAEDFAGIVRYGGYNHSIGMATHDVTGTFGGPDEVLQPGFVFACDIQLFRLKEEIGIRIEDTIAITEHGYENLSQGLPRSVSEIETMKKEKGPLQILNR
jgi:Xaa-Pro aminopeptidase